ncbi:EAL and HDOD domain-containing protein [Thalassotalea fusca]
MSVLFSRQPIFNSNQSVYGYQLSFEQPLKSVLTEQVRLNEGELLHFDSLVAKHKAFIVFDHPLVEAHWPRKFDPEKLVVEICAQENPSAELLQEIHTMHELGYNVCLSELANLSAWELVYPCIAYIKVNATAIDYDVLLPLVDCIGCYPHIQIIANNLDEREQFADAQRMGFSLFEGHYYATPEVGGKREVAPAESTLAELLYQTSQDGVDLKKVMETVSRDVYLTYKLLSYANTVFFKRREEVSTIKQAVVTLGLSEFQRFISVLLSATLCKGRSNELVRVSLYRGKFCELLCESIPGQQSHASEAFLAGLLSLIEALFNESKESAIEKLSLSSMLEKAIIKQRGPLASYIELAKACELGDWSNVFLISEKKKYTADLNTLNSEAIIWADSQMRFLNLAK